MGKTKHRGNKQSGEQAPAAQNPAVKAETAPWLAFLDPARQFFLRYGHWIAYGLILISVLQVLHYVATYGVNIGWEDELDEMIPFYKKWYAGTLSFWSFWHSNNEHHCVVPYLLIFGLNRLTHWNTMAELYFIQFQLVFILGLFLYAFGRMYSGPGRVWLMVPIAFLVYSLRQSQNYLLGCTVFVVTPAEALAGLMCLSFIDTPERWRLKYALAVLFGTLATFSAAPGVSVWPAGLVPLLLAPLPRRRKVILIAVWVVIGVVELILFLQDRGKPETHPQISFSIPFLINYSIPYFLNLLGGALFPLPTLATIVGAIIFFLLIASVVMIWLEGRLRQNSVWLAVLTFGMLVMAEITVGRAGFGPQQALSTRYATFSNFNVIGVYALLLSVSSAAFARAANVMWGMLLSLIVCGVAVSMFEGYEIGVQWSAQRTYHSFVFYTSDSQPDEALPTAPWQRDKVPWLRDGLAMMREHGLNVFSSPGLAEKYEVPKQSMPVLERRPRVAFAPLQFNKESGLITVAGCALDDHDNLASKLLIDVDGKFYPAYYGIARPEVAEALKNPAIENCGFQRQFSVRQLGSGRHLLNVRVFTSDGKAVLQPSDDVPFNLN